MLQWHQWDACPTNKVCLWHIPAIPAETILLTWWGFYTPALFSSSPPQYVTPFIYSSRRQRIIGSSAIRFSQRAPTHNRWLAALQNLMNSPSPYFLSYSFPLLQIEMYLFAAALTSAHHHISRLAHLGSFFRHQPRQRRLARQDTHRFNKRNMIYYCYVMLFIMYVMTSESMHLPFLCTPSL